METYSKFSRGYPGVNDGVYLNGCRLALRSKICFVGVSGLEKMDIREFVIVSLDLGTKTYTQLMPPGGYDEMSAIEPLLSILMDCLCFSNDYMRTHFVIWKMEEFVVEESWIQLLKINYQNLKSMYFDVYDLQNSQFLPLHLSDHGDTLILANKEEKQAILYNWEIIEHCELELLIEYTGSLPRFMLKAWFLWHFESVS